MKLRNFKKIIAVSVLFASSNVFSADTPLTTDELGNLMAEYINKATDVMVALRDNKADKADIAAYTKDMDDALNDISSNFENIGRELGTKVDYNSLNQFIEYVNSTNKELTESINKGFNTIDDKVNKLDKKVRKGLAAQAALTGLFQPYNIGKANITAAVGGYKSNTAIAIGTGYRFNEHVAAKAGIALSTGSGKAVSYNAGVNYEW